MLRGQIDTFLEFDGSNGISCVMGCEFTIGEKHGEISGNNSLSLLSGDAVQELPRLQKQLVTADGWRSARIALVASEFVLSKNFELRFRGQHERSIITAHY